MESAARLRAGEGLAHRTGALQRVLHAYVVELAGFAPELPPSSWDVPVPTAARAGFDAGLTEINTIIIDHLRIEYSAWVDLLRRGHAGLRGAYGSDYMSHFTGGRERVCDELSDEQLRGTFYPADGSVAVC